MRVIKGQAPGQVFDLRPRNADCDTAFATSLKSVNDGLHEKWREPSTVVHNTTRIQHVLRHALSTLELRYRDGGAADNKAGN
ncbi:hypothetical protein EVAR_79197_1 [Eumeta japonica]|uniref:Uncharacterized protein n=1 Tax=Eumeta variegata TaxID=151549 RepID=A0A4C1UT86_EUMVA|nr:hypothetical protein EVAR_79197_1 [Eumeta japonica]